MGKRQLVATAIAAAAVAGVAISGTPAHAKEQVEKPFRYVSEGTISDVVLEECVLVLPPTSSEPVLECDQQFAGVDERATHLGRTTSSATGVLTIFIARPSCTTPEEKPGTQFESNTERTIVAANGDELTISTTVTGCGEVGGLTEPAGTYTVTGGTGRFAGASGGGEVSSSVLDGILDTVWTGTITY